jgi:hypothetical protein
MKGWMAVIEGSSSQARDVSGTAIGERYMRKERQMLVDGDGRATVLVNSAWTWGLVAGEKKESPFDLLRPSTAPAPIDSSLREAGTRQGRNRSAT